MVDSSGGLGGSGSLSGLAVVTGAAHGIGLAVSQRLMDRGWSVVAVDADATELGRADLGEAQRVVAGVGGPSQWLADLIAEQGPVSVLVNNVARMEGRSFLDLPIEEVRRSMDITLLGTWELTKLVVEGMLEGGVRGSIVFNLSLHTERVRMCPDYSVAKAGLSMLAQELASELGPHGIRVNSVLPGAIDTWSDRIREPEEHRARSEAMVPLRRLGDPADVARAIEFLVDPAAAGYVTGAELRIDGGLNQFNWLHHIYGSAAAEAERTT